jgi:hypothetical protein
MSLLASHIYLIWLSKSEYTAHILGVNTQIAQNSISFPVTLRELISDDIPVLVSGAYSQRLGAVLSPLGYLKINGVEISPIHRTWLTDTLFCTDKTRGEAVILLRDDKLAAQFKDCLQTGPRLFRDGAAVVQSEENPTDAPSLKAYKETPRIHLFICKSDGDRASPVGFGITDQKMVISRLNALLPRLSINKKQACRDAVALSGSISAGMIVNGEVLGSDSYLLVSAIAIRRRTAER